VSSSLLLGALGAVGVLLYVLWDWLEHRKQAKIEREAADIAAMGELVAPSLHPLIDPDRCIASGACIAACPEKTVIGIIGGQARLVNPLSCIGHGACESACPVQAIQLVYGTKKRGVELPRIDPNFQTNLPGVYVVGELGGMGLIRNAINQGRQAADHIVGVSPRAELPRRGSNGTLDALVVGAGPAGIGATLRLLEAGLRVLLVDREDFGGTILHYPRAKVVMSGELEIPLFGKVRQSKMAKEELVSLWQEIREQLKPPVETGELVERLETNDDGMWTVHSDRASRRAANVILALGVRGSPRKLEVPGEEHPKVAYRLLEPEEFRGKHVLVVGGGNSAVESALGLAQLGGCASVSISYRRDQFARCRAENRRLIDEALKAGRIRGLLPSEVVAIEPESVTLSSEGQQIRLPNDAVIVQIGGTPPGDVLRSFGVDLVTKYGER